MQKIIEKILWSVFKKSLRSLLRFYSGYPYLTANHMERATIKIITLFIREKAKEKDSMNMDARYIEIARCFNCYVDSETREAKQYNKPLGF
jgi:hypothetical protein